MNTERYTRKKSTWKLKHAMHKDVYINERF